MTGSRTSRNLFLLVIATVILSVALSGCVTQSPSEGGMMTTPMMTTPMMTIPPTTAQPTPTPPVDQTACTVNADCVPAQCCHPTSCINREFKGVCTMLCTMSCEGPLDCGAGECRCVSGTCRVVPNPTPTPTTQRSGYSY